MTEIKDSRLVKHQVSCSIYINESDKPNSYMMSVPQVGVSINDQLRYAHDKSLAINAATSIISSYEHILSSMVDEDEAIRRLLVLRKEYQSQYD